MEVIKLGLGLVFFIFLFMLIYYLKCVNIYNSEAIMSKNIYKSLISIVCLLTFVNIVSLILPIFSFAKMGISSTSTTSLFGYQLIGKLLTNQLKDTAMITFVVSYITLIVVSIFMLMKAIQNIKNGEFTSKSLGVYSVVVFILAIVLSVFVSVLVNQPNLAELLNESSEVSFKVGVGAFACLFASTVSMCIAIGVRKVAKKNKN